jgi:predicted RNA binding protein YcfA (HicA-like mRNA interferase family)
MPRGFNGWAYKDVVKFLKSHGFYFFKEKQGSHEAWIRRTKDGDFIVDINKLTGGGTYPQLTLITMIGQSGIDRKEWRKWASS